MNELFFELIRFSIGTQSVLSRMPSAKEWQLLYDMAQKQSLIGICFAGVKKLCNFEEEYYAGMNEMLYLTWMGMAAKIQQRNEVVNRQCVELQTKLSASGLYTCILKGQGIAQLYDVHLSGLRQSGDIDVWVKGGFDVVNRFVQKTSPTDDIAYHRFHYYAFDGTEVELHHRPTLMRNLQDDKKLQHWCDSFSLDSFVHTEKGFDVPPLEFNRIFILTHIYRHFLFEGVGLRQVMDYYFVLCAESLSTLQKEKVMSVLKSVKMERFASAIMWVLNRCFGMDRKYMLCEPDEKEGKFLLSEILETGNFGHGETRYKRDSKVYRMVHHSLHLLLHYPSEVIWTPIWLIYHRLWKWNKRRVIKK